MIDNSNLKYIALIECTMIWIKVVKMWRGHQVKFSAWH